MSTREPISGTLTSGSSAVIPIPVAAKHIQIDAQGGGSLQVEVQVKGQPGFTDMVTFSDEMVILDVVSVINLRLSATVADVDYAISTYLEQ